MKNKKNVEFSDIEIWNNKVIENLKIAEEYRTSKDYLKAIEYYDLCIEFIEKIIHSGVRLRNMEDFRHGLSIIYSSKGTLCFALEQGPESVKIFKKALSFWPDNIIACYFVACDYAKKNDLDSAWKYASHSLNKNRKELYKIYNIGEDVRNLYPEIYTLLSYLAFKKNDTANYALYLKKCDYASLAKMFFIRNNRLEANKIAILALQRHAQLKEKSTLESETLGLLNKIRGVGLLLELIPKLDAITRVFFWKNEVVQTEPSLTFIFQKNKIRLANYVPFYKSEECENATLEEGQIIKVKLALRFFQQAESLGSEGMDFYLLRIYMLDHFKDPDKEIHYLKKWAEEEISGKLCLISYYLQSKEDVVKNLDFILSSAAAIEAKFIEEDQKEDSDCLETGEQNRASLGKIYDALAVYYSSLEESEENFNAILSCYRKAIKYGDSKINRFQLGFFLFKHAQDGNTRALDLAFKIFKQLTKTQESCVYFALGALYFNNKDYYRAITNFRLGYFNGDSACARWLYMLNSRMLTVFRNNQHPMYLKFKNELDEIISTLPKEEFIDNDKININKKFKLDLPNLYNESTFEEKLKILLTHCLSSKNPLALSTLINNIGRLIESQSYQNSVAEYLSSINSVITTLSKQLLSSICEPAIICQTITGISRLYSRGFNQNWQIIIQSLCKHMITNNFILTPQELTSLFSALIRTPLETNYLREELAVFVNKFLTEFENYTQNGEDIAGVFYHLSVLHNFKKHYPKIVIRNLREKEIKPLIEYAILQLQLEELDPVDKHQYFLSALYFSNHYKFDFDYEPLIIYKRNFKQEHCDINTSFLQMQVFGCLKPFFTLRSEKPINTLPVDMKAKGKKLVIQVDGPNGHFYYKGDQATDYQRGAKDLFHDAIINCKLPRADKEITKDSRYRIVHIHFKDFEKNGKKYLHKVFDQHGITLNFWDNGEKEQSTAQLSTAVGFHQSPRRQSPRVERSAKSTHYDRIEKGV